MMQRVREWVRSRVDAVLLPRVRQCVTEVAEPVDYQKLALELAGLKEFQRELRTSLVASLSMDSDLAEAIAQNIDTADIAYNLDTDDIAQTVQDNIEVDAEEVADRLDMHDLANRINYRDLCRCLLAELKGVT